MDLKHGDWVLLKFEKARLRKKKGKEKVYVKLSLRNYGLFRISEVINEVIFRLELPAPWQIHNAFHISLLKQYQGPELVDPVLEDPLVVEELEEILQPEKIVYHTIHKGPKGEKKFRFLKNYSALNAKWMDEDMLSTHPQLLDVYKEAFQLRTTD